MISQDSTALAAITLSPSQQRAYDKLMGLLPLGNIIEFSTKTGLGRSTVLQHVHRQLGGKFVTVTDFVEAAVSRHPLALEDALYHILHSALTKYEVVLVDDFHVATAPLAGGCSFNPRNGFLESPLTALAAYALANDRKLILGNSGKLLGAMGERSVVLEMENFSVEDYEHLCRQYLATKADSIAFDKLYHFAPKINAHQLRAACAWIRQEPTPTTETFIEYLRRQQLTSNVSLGEVADVELKDLVGVDEVIQSLEANVVLPLENEDLAGELALQPKRGVLLVGPPGTGKTTVGRALAHRLRGKFFLIDGTMISGTHDFYERIHRIFEDAKDNAPAVIFIDDSDVIFESGQEHGLYRYLLTMLDGLESKSAARVCVMMTAMDVGNLPPALVRSGRIELWLEMSLPEAAARHTILQRQFDAGPAVLQGADIASLVDATASFTGADLKRTFEDGKSLYAFDRAHGNPLKPITEYFLAAAETIHDSKEKYAAAEDRANATRPGRPAWFNPLSHIAQAARIGF